MNRYIVIALFMLLPQLATAKVYMCVDHATGQTSFTDQSCETASAREEVRVDPANLDSGSRYTTPAKAKTWRSEADRRKTGTEYSAERRSLYDNKTTVSTR